MPTDNPLARMWGKLTAPKPPPEPAATTGADYERERDERVARNRAIMRELGINNLASTMGLLEGGSKRKRTGARDKPRRSAAAQGPAHTSAPTRRSTRSTRHTGSFFDDVDADALRATIGERAGAARVVASSAPETHEDAREEDETFDDSGVLRYVAWGSADDGKGPSREPSSSSSSSSSSRQRPRGDGRLVGFAELPARFVDGACKKGFYSIDARGGLLAAGGDGGRCAVFGVSGALEPEEPFCGKEGQTRDGDGDGDEESAPRTDRATDHRGRSIRRQSPTLSWTAHRGWCSRVQFPNTSNSSSSDVPGSNPPSAVSANASYLLTAGGMDGTVCSWDLAVKSQATGAPKLTWRLDAGRGSGVFSMHHARDELLVGCKDWTVRRWRLGEGAVRGAVDLDTATCVEYDSLHRGVVRCVRWNDASADVARSSVFGDDSDVFNLELNLESSDGLGGGAAGPWLFASCGGDGRVAVVDTRIAPSRAKVAGVDDAHGGRPVNFVEWGRRGRKAGTRRAGAEGRGWGRGGGNGYSLLTSGGDAYVRLWDLRALATSLDETRRTGDDDDDGGESPGGESPARRMTLELSREFTGHHRAGLTKPKTMTRAVFVSGGNEGRDGPIGKVSGDADWNVLENDDDNAYVVTPGEQSLAVSLYRRARGFQNSSNPDETGLSRPRHPRLGECVSRGEVGFDPTAVFARASSPGGESPAPPGQSSSFGWSLALANRGEIRVYEPVREGGGVGAGGTSAPSRG